VTAVNAALRSIFDVLLFPFRALPPVAGLLVVSVAAAVLMLIVFKKTSNQARLEAVKRQIHACLFELRLFSDDLGAILRAQGEILRHNLRYLGLSAVPMLVMLVPLALVVAQLQFHYGYRGLRPADEFLFKVQLKEGHADARPQASLEAPAGLAVVTPAVWIPSERELAWRLRAERWGDYDLKLRLDGREYEKSAQVSPLVRRRSPVRLAPSFLNQFLYPAEDPLPADSPVSAITVGYAETDVPVFGWPVNWLVLFLVLSIAFAFALRKPLGVTL
jgi:uncharacterized membrane protein (DUF106 family)